MLQPSMRAAVPMHRVVIAGIFIVAALLVLTPAMAGAAGTIRAGAIEQIQAIIADKAQRTPAQQKIDSRLLEAERQRAGRASPNGAPALRTGITPDAKGRVLVDVSAEVTPALEKAIERLDGDILFSSARFDEIRAAMPLDALERLAARGDVRFVHGARKAGVNMINVSEGDVAHGAAAARGAIGADGSRITIGVMSDAVDELTTLQGSGDLPPTVTILPGQAGSGGSEGTAMLEIVYDLAPGSDLYFATAFGGLAQFAQNILDLQAAGADIIVDDIFYFAESPFQDDVVSQAVNTVTAAGVHYFSSAGNAGNFNDGTSGTWEGDFADGGAPPSPIVGDVAAHDWGGGSTTNRITVDSPFAFTLQWADPLGASANDYDLYLLSPDGTSVEASSTDIQNGTQDPFEIIDSGTFDDTDFLLVVIRNETAADRFLHLSTLRGQTEFNTPGETKGHQTADLAFGVAAVNVATAGGGLFTGGASNPVEPFSSDGPRQIFFEPDGTPITPGNFSSTGGRIRAKPDIAAADGVATATPGFNPFFGTSAAAPHAAAIAALVLDKNANANLRQVLTGTALDIEAPGPDRDSGAGILRADLAVLESTHPCCNTGGPGCIDPEIETAVCAADPFCCNVGWDNLCVQQVTTVAEDTCDCCEVHTDATGCYDLGAVPASSSAASSWAARHSLERLLYASDPQYFAEQPRDTIVLGRESNLRQPTRVAIDRTRARANTTVVRTATAATFPSEAATWVGGTPPPGAIGGFWSATEGHGIDEALGPDLSSGAGNVTRAIFDFTVPANSLVSTGVDWEVRLNGAVIGGFTIAVGQLGPVHLDFVFPPIVSASGIYAITFAVLNDVPSGDGSHMIGLDGVVQLVGQFRDDVSDCVCAADSYCCEVVWDSICVDEVDSLGCGLCETCTTTPVAVGPDPFDTQTNVLPDQDLFWNTAGSCTIANGGFETGSFAGWIPETGTGNELTPWNVGTADTSPGFFGNAFPFDGLYFAQNGFDGDAGLFYRLHQDIRIPAFATTVNVSWTERIQWDMLNFGGSTQPRAYSVVVGPAGGVGPIYGVLYDVLLDPGTAGDTGYVTHTFDLADIVPPGPERTVRLSFLQFIPEEFTGPGQIEIDAIAIQCALGKAQPPKIKAKPGNRSTPEREAHWRAKFAEKIARYEALQAGDVAPDAFHDAIGHRPGTRDVPPANSGDATRMLSGTLINFDDMAEPCAFGDAVPLTDRYASLGVTFIGPGGLDGAVVLDECGSFFNVSGQSSPNFLVFDYDSVLSNGGHPIAPETLVFDPPVRRVLAKVGAGDIATGAVTFEAYNALGNLVDTAVVGLESSLQPIAVEGDGIVRVVITNTPDTLWFALDDLRFETCPVTYSVSFGTDPGALAPIAECQDLSIPICEIDTLVPDTDYFWAVTSNGTGGFVDSPIWTFRTSGDTDGDGVLDALDNCIDRVNPNQVDSDNDNIGNRCDADIFPPGGGDCNVNFGDLSRLKEVFNPNPYDPVGDFNVDGLVNFGDLIFMKLTFFNSLEPGPGPSGLPNECASP